MIAGWVNQVMAREAADYARRGVSPSYDYRPNTGYRREARSRPKTGNFLFYIFFYFIKSSFRVTPVLPDEVDYLSLFKL